MAIKVTLRKKTISNKRKSLYLDFYPAIQNPETGKYSRREFLGYYLIDNPKTSIDKLHNSETLNIAEHIRQKRDNVLNKPEIYSGYELEQLKIIEKGDQDFILYFRNIAKKQKESVRKGWNSSLKYLEDYCKGEIKFIKINESFCNDFKNYILNANSKKILNNQIMKKTIYTLFAILGFANFTMAQVASEGSSHVYLGLGVPNPWYSTLSLLSPAYPESPSGTSFGPISINYEYAIKDKITIGGAFGYSSVSIPVVYSALNMDYKMNLSIMYFGAIGHYHYLNNDKSDLYSGVGLVYTSVSLNTEGNTGSNYKPVINIGGTGILLDLIGYRYMFNDNIGAYATINYGLAPVNIGLSGKF